MKEPDKITCPKCGKETPAGEACRNCGKDIESMPELEVQYRDFKGSEMLDIKMSSHARQEDEKQALKPAQERKEAANNGPQSEKKRARKKAVFFFWTTALIILSALTWYFLLKFLLKF